MSPILYRSSVSSLASYCKHRKVVCSISVAYLQKTPNCYISSLNAASKSCPQKAIRGFKIDKGCVWIAGHSMFGSQCLRYVDGLCRVLQPCMPRYQQFGSHSTIGSIETSVKISAIIEDDRHPLRDHHFSSSAWFVLKRLHSANHLVYIVGGAVRDVLLGRQPKDIDVLTSAEPDEVLQCFPGRRAFIVGKSFPVCHVLAPYESGSKSRSLIEVSSFTTNTDPSIIPSPFGIIPDRIHRKQSDDIFNESRNKSKKKKQEKHWAKLSKLNMIYKDQQIHQAYGDFVEKISGTDISTNTTDSKKWKKTEELQLLDEGKEALSQPESPVVPPGPTWAAARRFNALRRDFTVNAMLYDPFGRILYDYCGGMQDCKERTLRTIERPFVSFRQDPARILRAIRLAARAGLDFEFYTGHAMFSLGYLVFDLPPGRLQFEIASMLSRGGAASAVNLLWEFGLLEHLLPQHALLLIRDKFPRQVEGRNNFKANFKANESPLFLIRSQLTGNINAGSEIISSRPAQGSADVSALRSKSQEIVSTNIGNEFGDLKCSQILFRLLSKLDAIANQREEPVDPITYTSVLLIPLLVAERQSVKKRVKLKRSKDGKKDASVLLETDLELDSTQMKFDDPSCVKDRTENDDGPAESPTVTEKSTSRESLHEMIEIFEKELSENENDEGQLDLNSERLEELRVEVDSVVARLLQGVNKREQKSLESAQKKLHQKYRKLKINECYDEEYQPVADGAFKLDSFLCFLPRQSLLSAGEIIISVAEACGSTSSSPINRKKKKKKKMRALKAKKYAEAEEIVFKTILNSGISSQKIFDLK